MYLTVYSMLPLDSWLFVAFHLVLGSVLGTILTWGHVGSRQPSRRWGLYQHAGAHWRVMALLWSVCCGLRGDSHVISCVFSVYNV
ncbi:hypothetical protein BP00DRAFT_96611 [Aspergillus indologenus CBS 114.80]|uniref:Uncharacterized protein n=1 Tax=Aspergillus indologenus CBS 114.80 TaxID=1450541 RepID=A0A2V5ICR6_9EURO|nr:hypothetical protein BP00DRAFT_96611 [Aspergillus indologenus CBS 114.80]